MNIGENTRQPSKKIGIKAANIVSDLITMLIRHTNMIHIIVYKNNLPI